MIQMLNFLSVRGVNASPWLIEWVCGASIALLALVFVSPAVAEKGKLRERLTPEVMAVVFPGGAERLGPEEGAPPAIPVYQGDKVVAYLFSTLDIIAAPGYSTTPFDVIAGVDLDGRITGAKAVFHNEPYIVHDPKRQRLLDTFLAREAGRPLSGGSNLLPPDFVAGATISTRAMRAAVGITAGLVLRARVARTAVAAPAPAVAAPTLDVESFSRKSWDALLAADAVVRRRVTSGDVAAALAAAGAPDAQLEVTLGRGDRLYIEFATALFTPAAIGGNLVGMINFEDFKRKMPTDAQAIFIASNGPYNFLGTRYFQSSDRRFDRLRVVQDGKTFEFRQDDYQWVNPFGEGIRGQEDAGLFALPADSGFAPLKQWRLELLVNGEVIGPSATPVTVTFGLDYNVPDLQALTTSLDDTRGERRAQLPPASSQTGEGRVGGTGAGASTNADARRPAGPEAPLAPALVEALDDSPVPAWVD